MTEILHKILTKTTSDRVYTCLTAVGSLAGWWTSTTTGESAPGEALNFHFGEHVARMRVEALEPNRRVVWRCTDASSEWIDTLLTFELTEEQGGTLLRFGHRNWKEGSDFFAHCSMKWATFLLSLREFAETGKGRPYPHDVPV